jgi:hypothetical protein
MSPQSSSSSSSTSSSPHNEQYSSLFKPQFNSNPIRSSNLLLDSSSSSSLTSSTSSTFYPKSLLSHINSDKKLRLKTLDETINLNLLADAASTSSTFQHSNNENTSLQNNNNDNQQSNNNTKLPNLSKFPNHHPVNKEKVQIPKNNSNNKEISQYDSVETHLNENNNNNKPDISSALVQFNQMLILNYIQQFFQKVE